jgi:hypothetical protein
MQLLFDIVFQPAMFSTNFNVIVEPIFGSNEPFLLDVLVEMFGEEVLLKSRERRLSFAARNQGIV